MSRTLVGIVSYGGLRFLDMGLVALRESLGVFDVLVIAARPGDDEMNVYLWNHKIPCIIHHQNEGFPAAVNDLYDEAFGQGFECGGYDNLIVMGNDVIPMPGTIEAMINCADTTDYEMVCGSEFNAKFLYDHYPEARKFFHGEHLIFNDWGARPWLLHKDAQNGIEPDTRKDIRNLTLFKRSSFEKVGYADVNFWPNGYFEDNCYGRRCDLLNVKACGLKEAAFFHFTSRTIHQNAARDHHAYFRRNRDFYVQKWGGVPGQETKEPLLKIDSREQEAAAIEHWSKL